VLARRLIQRGGAVVPRVLVRWLGLPDSTVTWEDEDTLRRRFPAALSWGQASTQEGENVTTKPTTTRATAQEKVQDMARPKKDETCA
jgi:hypothetical protein